jgi:hypothetical protein
LKGRRTSAGSESATPADLCLHSLCGSYSNPGTGAVVSYLVSDERLPWEDPCHVPTSGVAFRGVLNGVEYCGFQAPDANEVELEELERLAPDLLCYVGDPDRVIMSPVEASLICVTFFDGNSICQFSSATCDDSQVAAFRDLVLSGGRLDIRAIGQ